MPRGDFRVATIRVYLLVVLTTFSLSVAVAEAQSVTITSPGAQATAGTTIPFSATVSGPVDGVSFWVNGVLYAMQYEEPYGIWLPDVAAGTHTLEVNVWNNLGGKAWDIRTLTVEPGEGSQALSVSITSPDTTTYAVGATIPFSASVSGGGGGTNVTFWLNGVLYGIQYAAPYSISLPNAAAGTYALEAVARDGNGGVASATRTLTVGSSSTSSNQSPVVSLTSPANGATFSAPASITFSATASDPDGTIAQVDFYANGTRLRTITASPYSFSWTNVSAGGYSIIAVARDNSGASTVSSTRDITVVAAGAGTTVVFEPSSNDATAVDRYVLDIFALGAELSTAYPIISRDLGKPAIQNGECAVDVTSTILALPSGSYVATVTAMGPGGSARSAPSPQFSR